MPSSSSSAISWPLLLLLLLAVLSLPYRNVAQNSSSHESMIWRITPLYNCKLTKIFRCRCRWSIHFFFSLSFFFFLILFNEHRIPLSYSVFGINAQMIQRVNGNVEYLCLNVCVCLCAVIYTSTYFYFFFCLLHSFIILLFSYFSSFKLCVHFNLVRFLVYNTNVGAAGLLWQMDGIEWRAAPPILSAVGCRDTL